MLSNTVASALEGLPGTEETSKFCSMFNKFFDCLNTRSTTEYIHKRKCDASPYESKEDKRLKVAFITIIRISTFKYSLIIVA